MATLYDNFGKIREVYPSNGESFGLQELYELLGCDQVDVLPCPDLINCFIVPLDGGAWVNTNAARAAARTGAISPDEHILGRALYCRNVEFR